MQSSNLTPSQIKHETSRLGEVVKTLYPYLSEAERNPAEKNLRRYFEVAIRIAQSADSSAGLTASEPVSSIKERSNVNLKI